MRFGYYRQIYLSVTLYGADMSAPGLYRFNANTLKRNALWL